MSNIGWSSNPEYEKLVNDVHMEALRDRTVKIEIPMIDKVNERPWDMARAFIDLHERLAMLDFCENHIIVDYDGSLDVKPEFVVDAV